MLALQSGQGRDTSLLMHSATYHPNCKGLGMVTSEHCIGGSSLILEYLTLYLQDIDGSKGASQNTGIIGSILEASDREGFAQVCILVFGCRKTDWKTIER